MTIKDLIEKLQGYPENMPITINKCMDYTESIGDTISVTEELYTAFPYSDMDEFHYINLEIADKDYWENNI